MDLLRRVFALVCGIFAWCATEVNARLEKLLNLATTLLSPKIAVVEEHEKSALRFRSFSEIPRQGYPVIGDTFGIIWNNRRHHEYLNDLHERHGPLFRSRVGKYDFLFLSDLEGIKKVSRACGKSPLRTGVSLLLDARHDIGRQPGVFSVDGELWLDYRRKMTNSLIRSDFNEAVKLVGAATTNFIARAKHFSDTDGKVTLEYELDKYTTTGILLYNKDFGCFDETGQSDGVKCVDAVRVMFHSLHKLLYYPVLCAKLFQKTSWDNHQKSLATVFDITQKWVDQAVKEATENPDMSSCMLHHLIQNSSLGEEPEALYGNIADLMIAGVHTLSTSLQIGIHTLSTRPEVQKKLHEEICSVLKDCDEIQQDHIQQMTYLQAVMEEIHRTYPAVLAVSRKLDEDTVILDHNIPKGTDIVVPTYAAGRSKKVFADADEFRPERWLRNDKSTTKSVNRQIVYPTFGIGARMCMGKRLADLETSMLYASLYKKYRTELSEDTPSSLQFETTMLMIPITPVSIRLIEW